jgi:hypothetical protein
MKNIGQSRRAFIRKAPSLIWNGTDRLIQAKAQRQGRRKQPNNKGKSR